MPKPDLNPQSAMKTATNRKQNTSMIKTIPKKSKGKTIIKSARPIQPASKTKTAPKTKKTTKPRAPKTQAPAGASNLTANVLDQVVALDTVPTTTTNDRLAVVYDHNGEPEPTTIPSLKTQPVLANGSVIVAEPLSSLAPLPVQPKKQALPHSDGSSVVMEPAMINEPVAPAEKVKATITNEDGILVVKEPTRQ